MPLSEVERERVEETALRQLREDVQAAKEADAQLQHERALLAALLGEPVSSAA